MTRACTRPRPEGPRRRAAAPGHRARARSHARRRRAKGGGNGKGNGGQPGGELARAAATTRCVPELGLIAAIEELLARAGRARGALASGDDAAVVRARPFAVTSIDTIADGVHFERSTHSPADIGHKALAVALSDLAAMGAEPGEAYVSLALPADSAEADALELVAGMTDAGRGGAHTTSPAATWWARRRSW